MESPFHPPKQPTADQNTEPSASRFCEPVTFDEIISRPTVRSYRILHVRTSRGRVEAHYYPTARPLRAIVYAGAIHHGFETPAVNLFAATALDMQHQGVAGFRVKFRKTDDAAECLYDLRVALQFLRTEGYREFTLVAYSGAAEPAVQVAAIEPLRGLALLGPRFETLTSLALAPAPRLLVLQGGRDERVRANAVRQMYATAADPKTLILLPHSTHSLAENSTEVHLKLRDWLA